MHIIVLENQPTAFRGGQHLSLLDVCNGLSQRGHSITLLYEKEGDLLNNYQNICTNIINVNRYIFHRKIDIFSLLLDIGKVNLQLANLKQAIVYSNQYQDSFFASVLALSKNIPFVCHLRQCPPKELTCQSRFGLKNAKQFMAVSNQAKADWVESGIAAEKINVIYNAINTDKFKPATDFILTRKEWNLPESTKVISYVGRIDREKGIETLILAFARLHKSSDSKLLIGGKPVTHASFEEGEKYCKSLKQLTIDLGIEQNVEFLGHIANPTSVYQVSDVAVLPSLCSEPFGRTIIESMACGTPVVASKTGGMTEILTGEFEKGLFEPGNEQDLAGTLGQFLDWREKDPSLGKRCRDRVISKFSLNIMVDRIEKVFLKVVQQ